MIRFFVPGPPVPQARPRFTRQGWAYDPRQCKDYKRIIAYIAREVYGHCEPLDGPVEVSVCFVLPIPQSWPLKKKDAARAGKIWPTKKPDGDNLTKLIWDALTGICYHDDAQIVRWPGGEKRYGDEPGVYITVDSID